jgi:hypothetical protein
VESKVECVVFKLEEYQLPFAFHSIQVTRMIAFQDVILGVSLVLRDVILHVKDIAKFFVRQHVNLIATIIARHSNRSLVIRKVKLNVGFNVKSCVKSFAKRLVK